MTKIEEVWKDIDGYEGYYQVSNTGTVRGVARVVKAGKRTHSVQSKILTPTIRNGYLSVKLLKNHKGKTISVHRLVAKTFIQNTANLPEVNHINGIKADNHLDNLEWCTKSENHKHAIRMGLKPRIFGFNKTNSNLTHTTAQVIRDAYAAGYRCKDIARYFKLNHATISHITHGRNWAIDKAIKA